MGDLTNICFDKASIAAFLHQNLNNHDHKTVVETINFSFTQLTDYRQSKKSETFGTILADKNALAIAKNL